MNNRNEIVMVAALTRSETGQSIMESHVLQASAGTSDRDIAAAHSELEHSTISHVYQLTPGRKLRVGRYTGTVWEATMQDAGCYYHSTMLVCRDGRIDDSGLFQQDRADR